jgi:hypothetical protein
MIRRSLVLRNGKSSFKKVRKEDANEQSENQNVSEFEGALYRTLLFLPPKESGSLLMTANAGTTPEGKRFVRIEGVNFTFSPSILIRGTVTNPQTKTLAKTVAAALEGKQHRLKFSASRRAHHGKEYR